MNKKRTWAAVAAAAAASLTLAACGGSSGGSSGGSTGGTGAGGGAKPVFNAGNAAVVNPSDEKGGIIKMADSDVWDSLDPANTYYGYAWNFARLYGRSLTMFKPAAGADGGTLVPDLAETLGKPSADAKTWTYTLRKGVKFEDGTPITSKDVKYAVERSLDKTTFPNGPTYFNDALDLQGYTSPYKDKSPDKLGLKAIETPDDATIVFKLKKPFSGFDYFAQLPATMPVPQSKDTGTKYQQHVISSGPYKFSENKIGQSFTMVRNDQWDPATDPNRKALPDGYEVSLKVNADDIDNRLLDGSLDVAVEGTGVQSAAQAKILADPKLKANADSAPLARTWYTAINSDVAPFDKIECRKAMEWAVDKVAYQNAFGGPIAGGDIATNIMPPIVPGQQKFDTYQTPGNTGDLTKAKEQLTACGQPNGFATAISYRPERPKEKAAAEALQQTLNKIGVKLTLKPYPAGDYFALYAGNPAFAKKNGLGLISMGWGADWPDGFGFMGQIADSRVIRAAGNTNLGVKDPAVDALIDKALANTDPTGREADWVSVDKKVMDDAYIIPGVWAHALQYRPETLTNVGVSFGLQMYDYTLMGKKK
jgi:peptide/nickel transport system substrate-binding protein